MWNKILKHKPKTFGVVGAHCYAMLLVISCGLRASVLTYTLRPTSQRSERTNNPLKNKNGSRDCKSDSIFELNLLHKELSSDTRTQRSQGGCFADLPDREGGPLSLLNFFIVEQQKTGNLYASENPFGCMLFNYFNIFI